MFKKNFTEGRALIILFLGVSFYVLLFFSSCCLKYYGFIYNDFDLAIHDQIIWNILHGSIFNSILGTDFLGNHVHLISFLVAPLYWFIPHPLFLLFLQTVFLAAGVYPLYGLARIYHDHRMSLVICLIYLLYPGLGFTNLYEFHPTCFATFFLLCTAYYFYKENFFLFNVFMALSLICQENIALIFIMWGIYAFFLKRPWKWVWWTTLLGLVYFFLCVHFILPGFNKNTFDFFRIYGPLGDSVGKVMQNCVMHPLSVMAYMFKPHKIYFLMQLFASVILVPFLSPLALLPVTLIFIQHLLSSRVTEVNLQYHYTAEIIPFIFVAFVFGLKKITNFVPDFKYLGGLLLLNALVFNLVLGPHIHLLRDWRDLNSDYKVVEEESFVEQVPKNASVVSTLKFLSHLSHRRDLYSFHYVYSGFNTLFTKSYHLPGNVQYALIDFNDLMTFTGFYKLRNYRNLDNFIKEGPWGSMDVRDSIVLFKKGVKNKFSLFDFIDDRVVPSHPVNLTIDGRIKLYGYDVKMLADHVHIILYWKLLRPEQKDVNLFIDFIDQNGAIIDRRNQPVCYRIWPTQAWKTGQLIEGHQYISISPELRKRFKFLMVGFYDLKTKKPVPTDSKDALGRIEINV